MSRVGGVTSLSVTMKVDLHVPVQRDLLCVTLCMHSSRCDLHNDSFKI